MTIKLISDENEFEEALDSHVFTVICFLNPQAERELFSAFKKLADDPLYAGYGFYYGDSSNSYDLMDIYGIVDTPVTLLFNNGDKFDEVKGTDLGPVMEQLC